MSEKKIGLLGGTFNPVHNGHIGLACYALNNFDLDEIWFIPNCLPPHKQMNNSSDLMDHRINMLKLATEGHSGFSICDIELKRGGKSYTYETLLNLSVLFPEYDFYFIIGEDSLHQFDLWVHPEIIAEKVHILAAHRSDQETNRNFYKQLDYLNDKYNNAFIPMEMTEIPVSSTLIRNMIHAGKDISGYVPVNVAEYIKINKLYI